jgi:hypothetical protein
MEWETSQYGLGAMGIHGMAMKVGIDAGWRCQTEDGCTAQ